MCLLIPCIAALATPFDAAAETYVYGGISYDIPYVYEGERAYVTGYDNATPDVTIPATISYQGTLLTVEFDSYMSFAGSSALTSVSIAEGVNYNNTFENCVNLTSAKIPGTEITTNRFYNCPKLDLSTVITSEITYIGESAFALPEPMECGSITIPEGILINYSSFNNRLFNEITTSRSIWEILDVSALKRLNYNGEYFNPTCALPVIAHITLGPSVTEFDYWYDEPELTTIDMENATSLKSFSLRNNSYNGANNRITELTIPATVETLSIAGLKALTSLKGCTGAKTVSITDCTLLENISLPAVEVLIGLFDNTNLKEVYLGATLKKIGLHGPFSGCKNLADLIYAGTLEQWNAVEFSFDGSDNDSYMDGPLYRVKRFWYGHGNTKHTYLTELNDLGAATTVNSGAFTGYKGLTKVSLPASVSTIGYYAFGGCTELTSVSINAKRIEGLSFYKTPKLTTLRLGDELEYVGPAFPTSNAEGQTLTVYYNGTYNQWNGIEFTNVLVWEDWHMRPGFATSDLLSIANGGFYVNGTLLDTIVYDDPETIKGVTGYKYLTKVVINCKSRFPKIEAGAFKFCNALRSVTYTADESLSTAGGFDVGNSAFYGCTALSEIGILDRLNSVDADAFLYTKWYMDQPDGPVYIRTTTQGKAAYLYKGRPTEDITVTFDDDTETILPVDAFVDMGQEHIIGVAFPEGLRVIGSNALRGTAISGVLTLPSTIESVGDQWACSSFTADRLVIADSSVPMKECGTWPGWNSIQSAYIGRDIESKVSIFNSFNTIKTLTYGPLVTKVGRASSTGESDFSPSALTDIYVNATVPPVCEPMETRAGGSAYAAFDGIDMSVCKLHVPAGCLEAYKAADGWKEFLNITEETESGISGIVAEPETEGAEHFNYMGQRINPTDKGLHIVRNIDGTTTKVIVR